MVVEPKGLDTLLKRALIPLILTGTGTDLGFPVADGHVVSDNNADNSGCRAAVAVQDVVCLATVERVFTTRPVETSHSQFSLRAELRSALHMKRTSDSGHIPAPNDIRDTTDLLSFISETNTKLKRN